MKGQALTGLPFFFSSTINNACRGGGHRYDCKAVDMGCMSHQEASLDCGAGFFICT